MCSELNCLLLLLLYINKIIIGDSKLPTIAVAQQQHYSGEAKYVFGIKLPLAIIIIIHK